MNGTRPQTSNIQGKVRKAFGKGSSWPFIFSEKLTNFLSLEWKELWIISNNNKWVCLHLDKIVWAVEYAFQLFICHKIVLGDFLQSFKNKEIIAVVASAPATWGSLEPQRLAYPWKPLKVKLPKS